MSIQHYTDLQDFIKKVLMANAEEGGVASAPHADFWMTLPYNDFVNGNVPGVVDNSTGNPIPILTKGNSATSNFVLSLQGKGPLFDPNTGSIGQMPGNGPPMFTDAQIKEIADWIDAGCPQ